MHYALFKAVKILSDCLAYAEIESVGYERVPDADLVKVGEGFVEIFEVFKVEVVSGIQSESDFKCCPGSLHKWSYRRLPVF